MKKHTKILLYAAVLLLTAAIMTASIYAKDANAPPMSVVVGLDDGYEYEIAPYGSSGKYYFLLPGTVDPKNITVKYTGSYMICDESGDVTLYSGDTVVCDGSRGTVSIKEYDSTQKKYITYSVDVMFGSDIGSVYITLDGGDKAFKKVNTSKDNEEPGDITVVDMAGNLVYDGEMSKLSGHGFTSYTTGPNSQVKNSFNFNISEKTELIYGAGDARKWVLLTPRRYAGDRDMTGLSQIAAFRTYSAIIGNKRASIEGEYVDLYVNGEYRGLYILTERMNDGGAIDVKGLEDYVTPSGNLETIRDYENNGRDPALNTGLHKYTYDKNAKLTDKSIDITGGYVLEVMCDNYEGCGFETEHGLNIAIKSPESCTKEMVRYIAAYVQNFENALYSETGYNSEGKHYSEYIDMRSLADTVLVYAYYINFEYFRTSTYMYKDADGEANDVLTFGPAWDFETNAYFLENDPTLFGTTNGFTYNVLQQYIWSEQLWQHGDFMEYLYEENERMKTALSELTGRTESTTVPSLQSTVDAVADSADMNHKRWGGDNFNDMLDDFVRAVDTRFSRWYDTLWNPEEYMVYITVSAKENEDGTITLTASSMGENDGYYRWYRIDADEPHKSYIFATRKESITVDADGTMYYCTVKGANNAYYEYASGEIFSSDTVTMKTANVAAVEGVFIDPPETEPTTEPEPPANAPASGCGGAIGFAAVPIVIVLTFASAVTFKKEY